MQQRNIAIVKDIEGNEIVLIHDIRFKGKRQIKWEDVEDYLRKYIGTFYQIAESGDLIYIGKDLPDEYTNSEYSEQIRGGNAKAKANAAQGIPEMLAIAANKSMKKIGKQSIERMPLLVGTGMTPDLHCQSMMEKKLNDTMYSVR